MKSAALGRHTSGAEVTNISKHGFWLLQANEELFVAFKDFPWFKDASIAEIVRVDWPQPPSSLLAGSRRGSRSRIHQTTGELSAHLKENAPRQASAPTNEDRAPLAHHHSFSPTHQQ
ncbi:MAG: DUF2442 domain-containing protein [Nitrospira sp.]|nr:DUF2442 domain-containing protein [Nitrospira sp.]